MKVSLSWLKEYIPVDMDVAELTHALTMAGLEVDGVEERYTHLEGVVVSQIVEADPHPNADKLKICKVDTGSEVISVVCGAPNAAKGMFVPCALPGAVMPGGMVIKKGKLRGEVSEGMLCSGTELEIDIDASGILDLGEGMTPGTPLADALALRDSTIEIDLTPNRPDCLSLIGTAREIGAFRENSSRVKLPEINLPEASLNYKDITAYTSVAIKDPDHCPRYAARLVFDIKVGPSPFWLQERLLSVGLKPINNIVDITNFVMMETGQPLHAFDYDGLAENRIEVKCAAQGEKFTTLDGVEHVLAGDMLMICDGEKSVAIAGVMGGLNSEIEDGTTKVLIESACFDPSSVRKTSKKTGIHTDAAHRFERGTDPDGVVFALNRAAALMAELAGGELVDGIIDEYPHVIVPKVITLSVEALNRRLGTRFDSSEIKSLLERVEFTVGFSDVNDESTLLVTPPSFRVDVTRPEDLSEEVARIWGYNRIETTFPAIPADAVPLAQNLSAKNSVRMMLSGIGFSEVINYSFISALSCDNLSLAEDDRRRAIVKIINPISEEMSVMRTSLVPGFLSCVQKNNSRQVRNLSLFEIGKVFYGRGEGELPEEVEMLTGVMTGSRNDASWYSKEEAVDFFDLKGAIEGFFEGLHIDNLTFAPLNVAGNPYLMRGYCAAIMAGDLMIGHLGKVQPAVLKNFDLRQDVYLFEVDLGLFAPLVVDERKAGDIPRYPAVTRDTTVICKEGVLAGDIVKKIMGAGEKLVESIYLLDVYCGEPIAEGMRSLSFRITYRSESKTLQDKAVNKIHTRLTQLVLKGFDATLPA